MTNELGTTLQELEDKAERKREALNALDYFKIGGFKHPDLGNKWQKIRQYIEQS